MKPRCWNSFLMANLRNGRVHTRHFIFQLLSAVCFPVCLSSLVAQHPLKEGCSSSICSIWWPPRIHVTGHLPPTADDHHGTGTAALGEISPNSRWPSVIMRQTLKCHRPLEGQVVHIGNWRVFRSGAVGESHWRENAKRSFPLRIKAHSIKWSITAGGFIQLKRTGSEILSHLLWWIYELFFCSRHLRLNKCFCWGPEKQVCCIWGRWCICKQVEHMSGSCLGEEGFPLSLCASQVSEHKNVWAVLFWIK